MTGPAQQGSFRGKAQGITVGGLKSETPCASALFRGSWKRRRLCRSAAGCARQDGRAGAVEIAPAAPARILLVRCGCPSRFKGQDCANRDRKKPVPKHQEAAPTRRTAFRRSGLSGGAVMNGGSGSRAVLAGSPSPLMGPADHHVDPSAAALAAHDPCGPIWDRHLVSLRHLDGIGLDLDAGNRDTTRSIEGEPLRCCRVWLAAQERISPAAAPSANKPRRRIDLRGRQGLARHYEPPSKGRYSRRRG